MTKLLTVGVCALGFMLAGGAAGCEKKDDDKSAKSDKKDEKDKKAEAVKVAETTDTAKTDDKKAEKKDDSGETKPPEASPDSAKTATAAATGDVSTEIKKAVDDVCKCKDKACADAISTRMRTLVMTKMAAMPAKDKLAFMQKLQKDHKADMERAKKCAEKFKGTATTATKTAGKGLGAATMKKLGGFSDKICACKDLACAKKVQKDMQTWAMSMQKSGAKPTAEEQKALMPVMKKFGKCYSDLLRAKK